MFERFRTRDLKSAPLTLCSDFLVCPWQHAECRTVPTVPHCAVPITWQQPNSLKIWTTICSRGFCGKEPHSARSAPWPATQFGIRTPQSWSRTGTQSQLLDWEQLFN